MKALFVDREDRHLGTFENARVVQGADLENHGARHARRSGQDMRSAICAEFAGHGVVEIAAGEALGLSLGVAEAGLGESHHVVGAAAGPVLAFTTVALALEERVALGLEA